jgi:hypothetical protein
MTDQQTFLMRFPPAHKSARGETAGRFYHSLHGPHDMLVKEQSPCAACLPQKLNPACPRLPVAGKPSTRSCPTMLLLCTQTSLATHTSDPYPMSSNGLAPLNTLAVTQVIKARVQSQRQLGARASGLLCPTREESP